MGKNTKDTNLWDKKRLLVETITALIICFVGIKFGESKSIINYNGDVITYEVYADMVKSIDEVNNVASESTQGEEIAEYAMQFIGSPYVYGGIGLTTGVDSSGFVKTVFKHFGFSVPRSIEGIKSIGEEVTLAQVRAGDIVCYGRDIGISIGNGKIIYSSESVGKVITSEINDAATVTVRRIIN